MNGSIARARIVIEAPRYANRFDGIVKSLRDPHGPRLAESKRSISLKGREAENHSHFNSLIPSATGRSIADFRIEEKMATRELMEIIDGHFGNGLF